MRSRLQTILDKPLSVEMLDQLSHSAHAAKEFLFVSGDQDAELGGEASKPDLYEGAQKQLEERDNTAEFHASSLPGLHGLKEDSLDEIRDAFTNLLRVLGKEEDFEAIVKDIVKNFKIVMG